MESSGWAGLSPGGCIVRKKRSVVSHKPRLGPPTFSPSSFGKGSFDENQNSKKVAISDGLRSENMPKKLKLKFGGVTHTIHTKYTEDFGLGGRSSITISSSSTPQLNLLPQDGVGGGRFGSDGRNGFGVTRKDHSKIDSSSRKEYSLKGKIFKESSPIDNEPVHKSKRVPNGSVLDEGLNEDDEEDEEIRFLGRLKASKVTRSKRIQMDDDFHGNDTGEYKQSKLGKHSRKKSRSDKLYEDKDYLEEDEELTSESDDVSGSNGKKQKKGSLLLLEGWNESTPTTRNQALQSGKDILTGSGSGFLDLANHLLPAPSKRKKENISEMDRQVKKAEAAQKRKVQLEKAARKAEAEAIRKILGQDSKRKKREEKLKQQRDELMQARSSSGVTLAPNTVRWIIGPNGTIVTFSDDVGLPGIFSPVPCSYPPPREKCAGPNCTNAYKYRDSKSKLPLCSLHCYKAIHEKTQPLIAC